MVEGDLADALARLGPGEATVHERFGTATLRTPDGCIYDLVRARAETLRAHPGALPEVRPGTLAEDLRRRDVTVNALALRPDGELVGVPGAREDLRDGVLRVLHDASFADDPTRLWRVARYAARLGFAVDPHTGALAAAADPGTVSGDRLGAELRLALREPDPFAALRAAAALQPRLLPPGYAVREDAGRAALALLPPGGRGDLVVLASGAGGVDLSALLAWLDAHGVPRGRPRPRRRRLARRHGGRRCAPHGRRRRSRAPRAARRWRPSRWPGATAARRWLEDLRHVRLAITGDDLLAAGVPRGPEVGERLRRALDAKLDGAGAGPRRRAARRAGRAGPGGRLA